MRPARILLLLVALLAGGVAAFLATRGNAPQPQQATVTKVEKEARMQILVASAPVGVGERLSPQNIEWQEWPEGAVRPEYVTINAVPDAIDQLTGAVARFEIFAGEPLREAKLARVDQGYLSAVLTPGMRGVSIGVSAEAGAGGFIVPNDRVDVVLSSKSSQGQVSETILQNVKVLAIGLRLGQLGRSGDVEDPESDDPNTQTFSRATIATLELTPEQSEVIVNAGKIGSLSLVLRSVADFADRPQQLMTDEDNSTVRLIRFGKERSIISSAQPIPGNEQSVQTAPVVYSPEEFDNFIQPPQPGDFQIPPGANAEPFAPPNPTPVE